jgi:hypothetical protein
MAQLAAAAPWLQGAGTVLSAVGSIQQGNAAADAGNSEAAQLNYRAGQTRASTQRSYIEGLRQSRLVASRGRAVAAASGAGATDPTVVKTLADVSAAGEYEALTKLYEGNDAAIGMEASAGARRREGSSARTSGYLKAASTVLNQGVSLWDKYGS